MKKYQEIIMKIVTISGSVREGNNTDKVLGVVESYLKKQGVEVVRIDAKGLQLSMPGAAETEDSAKIKEWVESADGVVMATPEYHGSYSSVIKMIIENLGFPSVLSAKPVSLLGVAAGQLGALKSLEHLRSVTAHLGMFALPKSVSIAAVHTVFDDEGVIKDDALRERIEGLGQQLIDFAS